MLVRPATGTAPGAPLSFAAGQVVEYYSVSQGAWILARVLAEKPTGLYDLDCKPDVPPQKIRLPTGPHAQLSQPSRPASIAQAANTTTTAAHTSAMSATLTTPGALRATVPTTTTGPGDLVAPVQLLRIRRDGARWRYEVCEEGARLLERHGGQAISVASICGVYRSGKSYLLNLLLERVQKGLPLFRVGGTTQACTEGLWLWACEEVPPDADMDARSRPPLLVFMDCEGFGSTDSDRSRDAQLMTLCSLLSSVVMLNTKGALNEGLFSSLSLTCRFAEHLDDKSSQVSRPYLLWVLRDFVLQLCDQKGCQITPDQYLEQALEAAPLDGHDQQRSQSAREARESLRRFFVRRMCATLVQPIIDEDKLQELDKQPFHQLRPEFQHGLETLRGQVFAACAENPKRVGGQQLSCVSFVALLHKLVQALNENKMMDVRNAWDGVQHGACSALANSVLAAIRENVAALQRGERISLDDTGANSLKLPMPQEALQAALAKYAGLLKADFDSRAVGDDVVRAQYWKEVEEAMQMDQQTLLQQNAKLLAEAAATAAASKPSIAPAAVGGQPPPLPPPPSAAPAAAQVAAQQAAQQASAELASLKRSHEAVAADAKQAQEDRSRLQEQVKTLKADLSAAQSEADSAKHEKQMLTDSVAAKQSRIDSLEASNKRLEEDWKAMASGHAGNADQLLERERLVGKLEGQVQALTAEAERERSRLGELQAKLSEAEGAVTKQRAEIEQLQKELATTQTNHSQLMNEHLAVQAEKRHLEKEHAAAATTQHVAAPPPVEVRKQPKCGCAIQ
eukprot:TRINITY_DN26093_c0_g1_i2.p1 TRINITY_DN26093_c0_g1~~TRINITY_DN26093_c0_g1_i2.p1  ORF type:complete len:795 (-),score=233.53 TRINITY_DN26093_c0_g1_i2:97-2481(-)